MKHDHPPVAAHNWRTTVDGTSPPHWLRLSAATTANADPALRRLGQSERLGNRKRRCTLWDHQRRRRHWPSALVESAGVFRRHLELQGALQVYDPKNGSRPCALNVEVVIMVQHAQRRRGR